MTRSSPPVVAGLYSRAGTRGEGGRTGAMLISIVMFLVLVLVVWYRGLPLVTASWWIGIGALLLTLAHGGMVFLLLPTLAVIAVLNLPALRERVLVRPAYHALRGAMPKMSRTE